MQSQCPPANVDSGFTVVLRCLICGVAICVMLEGFALAADSPTDAPSLADLAERSEWVNLKLKLRSGADPNAQQPDGTTALHWAVYHQDQPSIDALIEAGVEVDVPNRYDVTPLAIACRYGSYATAKRLLDAGANAKGATAGEETYLMHASRLGDHALVRALIDRGADVNQRQRDKQTALMWAAAAGHEPVVDALLIAGAELDVRLRSGFTALHFAARQGHFDVVHRLLDAGADVNDRMNPINASGRAPRKGMSPLMLAVESAHFQLAIELIDRGADPNDQRSGFAPLHALSWVRRPPRGDNPDGDPPPVGSGTLGSLAFAKELVARGADVNLQLERGRYAKAKLNPKGGTPLLFAAFTNDVAYADVLVGLGADVTLANADGTTPMLAAAGVGVFVADEYPGFEDETLAMIDRLVRWGATIDDVDAHGETVIHGAAYRSFARVVDRFMELGADPHRWNRKNSLGSTPLQVAQGKRPGSFKPNQLTIAAISRALESAGIKPEMWTRSGPAWSD
ncbi:ankyrin repeat domain-containing protein [Roseiconus lacunae]|uniref:Ankyrin repeat domain-containing protein n=1 Tax=Roseiconus lacunae TaxID=2605694 RepID=A0ABT7PGB5_9BACT|nr:ankyrin repeat domain-containing protein [Roseiconus lacunae]MDM4015296.1 ankyrin repeat domain-containing protein [Roseiconus lacunae]